MMSARPLFLLGAALALAAVAEERPPLAPAAETSLGAPAQDSSAVAEPTPVETRATAPDQPPREEQETASRRPARRSGAPDRLELETSVITGNRELPKVLYIVPWKKSELGELNGRPTGSLLDEVLAPVDREVFRRQNDYFDELARGADQAPRD